MIELNSKIENLCKKLDNEDCIKKNKYLLEQVLKNKDLVEKIEEYNLTKNSNLRLDIYKYEEMINYKETENNINLLILEINKVFKNKFKRSGCNYENN